MSRLLIAVLMLTLVLALVACNGGDDAGEAPTLAPTVVEGEASGEGDSPRVTPGAGEIGLPPTWTPGPPPDVATPMTSVNRPAPGAGASVGEVYQIQEGDTLESIAEQFDVTLESLVEANAIDDVNSIEVGQLIVIPRD